MSGKGRHLLVGVTGGIATGKSTVSRMLEELGAPLIDTDVLARQVVEPGTRAWKEIAGFFGEGALQGDGRIDRKRLSAVVFQDPEKRRVLEGITHPRIFEEMSRRIEEIALQDPDAIIQIAFPLLIEMGLRQRFHKVLLVYSPREMQVQRLMARDGIGREAAENILKAQLPIDQKVEQADYVIHNEGSLEGTRRQVEEVWEKLKEDQKKAGSENILRQSRDSR